MSDLIDRQAAIDVLDRNHILGQGLLNDTLDNCRWATMCEQDNNRRNTIIVTWNGETHSLSEWSSIIGINKSTLSNRYWRGDRGDRLFEERRYKCHAV